MRSGEEILLGRFRCQDGDSPPAACRYGVWLSLVERSVRDREVAGSNPVIPTGRKALMMLGLLENTSVFGVFYINIHRYEI